MATTLTKKTKTPAAAAPVAVSKPKTKKAAKQEEPEVALPTIAPNSRKGYDWSVEEETLLLGFIKGGVPLADMALKLGRSGGSVNARLEIMAVRMNKAGSTGEEIYRRLGVGTTTLEQAIIKHGDYAWKYQSPKIEKLVLEKKVSKATEKTKTIEARLSALETEVHELKGLITRLVEKLE